MADYYPLISRAVAGLEKNTGETRRALYERARTALVAQLRGVTPPLSETDITRERLALEESIRKVEAESARQFVDPATVPPPKPRASEPPQWEAQPRPPRDDAFRAASPPRSPAAPRKAACAAALPAAAAAAARRRARMRRRPRRGRRPPPPSAPSMPGSRQSDSMFDQPLPPEPVSPPPSPPTALRRAGASLAVRRRAEGFPRRRLRGQRARRRFGARCAVGARCLCGGPAAIPRRRPTSTITSRNSIGPSSGCSSSTRCKNGRRTRISPSRCWSRRSRSTMTRPAPPKARRAPPPHVEDEEERARARQRRGAPLLWRHHPGGRGVRDRRLLGRRGRVAMVEHGGALPRVPRASTRGRAARRPAADCAEGRRRAGSSLAAFAAGDQPGAGRGGRAEGGALRGGSDRSAGQALCRLGDLADRDRVAGPGTAARACDPCRRRDARPQAGDDLVAAAQHRQGAAGEPHRRDHVQAAGRISPPAASPTCPAS